jgi:hypothetical protein
VRELRDRAGLPSFDAIIFALATRALEEAQRSATP